MTNGTTVGFAVLYRWRLVVGRERDFEAAWAELTRMIRARCGGLGSRLQRCADGTYCAYAQWPSRATWESMVLDDPRAGELRAAMAAAVEQVLPTETFDVVADLLGPVAH
ncbi:Antibiotic biosynthesis monooxygenase [Planctomycetes bacterium Pla163]|uniref:Antibiotic biosynthesis monooxygenase n=1 Tax=Rohdeia mirabilis TaxID=2528008 RepID=A0A518CYG2_9BACT|nr:Antibiotic biosynthesis monooxygenase [Planctomycetes bacterium Pla163]